jgi:hypothetical protein
MWVANLVEPWKGDSNSIPVIDFFESINEAAEMGRLSSKDKVRLARLKLRGAARTFYSAQSKLRADDVTYEEFRATFVTRFKEKHTDQYHYARVQNASQEKNESPEVFLDRLRKLCLRTVRSSDNPVEQGVINQEAERRLLAAFINGLIGAPGRQVRLEMPETVDKALNMAIIVTNAEKEEKSSVQENWGRSTKVFVVGCNRGNTPNIRYSNNGNRYEKPRSGKFQWSKGRCAWSQHRAGPTQYSTGVDGTYSYRTDSRTPTQYEYNGWTVGGGAASGPKNADERYAPQRPRGIQCYNCGLIGHTRSSCPRGQRGNLNGIEKTNVTPPSYPK